MDVEAGLLRAIHEDPQDQTPWLVLADWLEERDDRRGELLRLFLHFRQAPWGKGDPDKRKRLKQLLTQGVRPCLPTVTGAVGMVFVLIPPGQFWMGSAKTERGRYPDETPLHEVKITQPFYLGMFPVTQEQYKLATGINPSCFSAEGINSSAVQDLDTSHFPVENVTWNDAVSFCKALSSLPGEKKARRTYRLPTEAEWEYACRAGISATPFHLTSTISWRRVNHDGKREHSLQRPCPVGGYPPNAFGLYDVHGNVWEWCQDWFDPNYYEQSPLEDPQGPSETGHHVFRGGSWYSYPRNCRAACRSADRVDFSSGYVGMRVVLEWRKDLT